MAANAEQFNFSLDDLNSIRFTRHRAEAMCNEPFFKDTISGCFVRIGIGNPQAHNYIIGQVADVVTIQPAYVLGKTRTNKGLKLKNAKTHERIYRMNLISNSEVTTSEYQKWLADQCELPCSDFVEKKKLGLFQSLGALAKSFNLRRLAHKSNESPMLSSKSDKSSHGSASQEKSKKSRENAKNKVKSSATRKEKEPVADLLDDNQFPSATESDTT